MYSDEFENKIDKLERELEKTRDKQEYDFRVRLKDKWLSLIFASLLTLGGAGGVGYTYHNSDLNQDNIIENTQIVSLNANKLNELEIKITKLELMKQLNTNTSDSGAGVCSCIKKDNSTIQSLKLCPTQNGVCDSEARSICEGVLGPEYEC